MIIKLSSYLLPNFGMEVSKLAKVCFSSSFFYVKIRRILLIFFFLYEYNIRRTNFINDTLWTIILKHIISKIGPNFRWLRAKYWWEIWRRPNDHFWYVSKVVLTYVWMLKLKFKASMVSNDDVVTYVQTRFACQVLFIIIVVVFLIVNHD